MVMVGDVVDGWRRFHFEGNMFFDSVYGPADWLRLRQVYPKLSDDELLESKEATYNGCRDQLDRDVRPNYGLRWEHDGDRTLRDFFVAHNMLHLLPPR